MKKLILLILLSFLLISCEGEIPVSKTNTSKRFSVESQGGFNAGYSNHEREILIITDTETGKKYLGITGVGVTEMFQSGKTTAEE
jgi:uncharacterized protein YcfL